MPCFLKEKAALHLQSRRSFGRGGRIRTDDLRVMSPTSYQTAPPRNMWNSVFGFQCCDVGYESVSPVSGRLVSPVCQIIIPAQSLFFYFVLAALSGRAVIHSPRIPPNSSKPAISIPPSQCLYDIREKGHPESLFRKHCRRSTDAGLRLEEMGHI